MAQYKVPQDVEADDKLIGPFSFRQFIYLLIAAGAIGLAVVLFQVFPVLAILPVPAVLFFAALALPLKKDQPMETYLAAVVSYYLKPRNRVWTPGQRETTIKITAPKIVEESRTRDISGEEATHRLSFLADLVDTQGYAIKGMGPNREVNDLVVEADSMADMFETGHFERLEDTIVKDENERHQEVVREMKQAIYDTENLNSAKIIGKSGMLEQPATDMGERPDFNSDVVVAPTGGEAEPAVEKAEVQEQKSEENQQNLAKPSIMELANNDDFSVATIEKEANRIKAKEEGEVFISLH